MDKTLLKTKFMDIYFSTLQIGVGVFFVPEHRTLHITLLVLEFCFYFGGEVEDGNDTTNTGSN